MLPAPLRGAATLLAVLALAAGSPRRAGVRAASAKIGRAHV